MTQANALKTEARYFLIHQPGKVGSQTIEQVVRSAHPGACVERHHYLSDWGIAQLEKVAQLPIGETADDPKIGLVPQLRAALAVRDQIGDLSGITVVTGCREPLDRSVSAFFQNIETHCPWLTYEACHLNTETEQLIEFFNEKITKFLSGAVPQTFNEGLLWLKFDNQQEWFEHEFNELYGVDIYDYKMNKTAFVLLHSKNKIVFYRAEYLRQSMRSILNVIGLKPPFELREVNVTDNKPYAKLYASFRHQYRPSSDVFDYYRGSRFYRHFYG